MVRPKSPLDGRGTMKYSKRRSGKPAGFQLRLPLKARRPGRTGSGLRMPGRGAVESVCNQASSASGGVNV